MRAPAFQPRLDDLATPLHAVTFVVVDLETTGGSPNDSRITEVGAVKVRGGEVLGELATLVNPCVAIPRGISALTGITDAMVAAFPPIEAVLPSFVEFSRGAMLVAHNARFDTGFLNANLVRLGYPRLEHPVVCTAALARRLVRDEVRDCRLATLAGFFRCRTLPVHRALADARATVEVLHGLLERAGSFGVVTAEDLVEFVRVRNAPLYRARKGLADGLPRSPGVYTFRSATGEALYVGKATDLRARVRSYFGGDERRKIADLLRETAAIDHRVTPTPLEAAVREVRLIAAHRPRYNRRSKHPRRGVWLKLTIERFPRLSIVRAPRDDGATYLGPLGSRRVADRVVEALHDAVPLRRCSARIGPRTRFTACALAEMGRCLAPCDGRVGPDGYAPAVAAVTAALTADPAPVLDQLAARLRRLAAQARYEEAAAARDRLAALVAALRRTRQLAGVAAPAELAASRPARDAGGREVVLVRHGRLVASTVTVPCEVEAAVARLRAAAPRPGDASAHVAADDAEEISLVAGWLHGRGVVLHHCEGELTSLVAGGRVLAQESQRLAASLRTTGRAHAELAAKRTRR
ncbi:MAG TPA: DEDD exonuclease domain-containing protein [Egibacteraceae bacterium]|nr:DEDD exonuclease domain-containing protein [Egibacteraceae bacterium]